MIRKPQPTKTEILERIKAARKKLGSDLVVLAHFYQNDDIIQSADFIGDSLQLAQAASKQKDARYIIFCSVSFMAEMARIICSPEQIVFHPETKARCPLAEMANIDDVEKAWITLKKTGKRIIPVVYVNSNADLKAFCGKNEGLVCTSANVKKVMEHVFSRNAVPFFFPDENLGRNMAHTMGISDEEMFLWDPYETDGSSNRASMNNTRIFLWRGFCIVHTVILPSHVEAIKRQYEGIKVIVHPECTPDTVNVSDLAGSTSFIKNTVEKSAPGSSWAIGTEINFVDRIRKENPDKLIVPLLGSGCREMAKVTPEKLLRVLEYLVEGRAVDPVLVDGTYTEHARLALKRMLEIT